MEINMMFIFVCIGSSCHLKGSHDIVKLFEQAIEEYSLQDMVVLAGSFCLGKCNRTGVTVKIDDDIHVGINKENFNDFFNEHILKKLKEKGA